MGAGVYVGGGGLAPAAVVGVGGTEVAVGLAEGTGVVVGAGVDVGMGVEVGSGVGVGIEVGVGRGFNSHKPAGETSPVGIQLYKLQDHSSTQGGSNVPE